MQSCTQQATTTTIINIIIVYKSTFSQFSNAGSSKNYCVQYDTIALSLHYNTMFSCVVKKRNERQLDFIRSSTRNMSHIYYISMSHNIVWGILVATSYQCPPFPITALGFMNPVGWDCWIEPQHSEGRGAWSPTNNKNRITIPPYFVHVEMVQWVAVSNWVIVTTNSG